jgi:hypothetical protein
MGKEILTIYYDMLLPNRKNKALMKLLAATYGKEAEKTKTGFKIVCDPAEHKKVTLCLTKLSAKKSQIEKISSKGIDIRWDVKKEI